MSGAAPRRTTSSQPVAGVAGRASDNLVNLRRRSDWTGEERGGEDSRYAAYRAAVDVAAATLTAFDGDTGDHSDDVRTIAEAIAERLGLTDVERSHVLAAAQLHDIGKVGVPSQVITKTGPLDDAEWELVREHTVMGEQILGKVPEMAAVAGIVRHSHERWDGGGYPDGLSGEDIPLASRIVFCADAFHAMRCDRSYRRGRSARRAFAEIEKHSGTQFDPQVVDVLHGVAEELAARRRRRAVFSSKRTQRLAALLLALTVSSSALAATGAWRRLPATGGGTPPPAAGACGPGGCMAPAPSGVAPQLPQSLVPVSTLANGHGTRVHARAGGPETRADSSPAPRRTPADRKPGGSVAGRSDSASTAPGDGGRAPAVGSSTGVGGGGTTKLPGVSVDLPLDTEPPALPEVRLPEVWLPGPVRRLPPEVNVHLGLGGGRDSRR